MAAATHFFAFKLAANGWTLSPNPNNDRFNRLVVTMNTYLSMSTSRIYSSRHDICVVRAMAEAFFDDFDNTIIHQRDTKFQVARYSLLHGCCLADQSVSSVSHISGQQHYWHSLVALELSKRKTSRNSNNRVDCEFALCMVATVYIVGLGNMTSLSRWTIYTRSRSLIGAWFVLPRTSESKF
jgi:hypothetical protein